MPTNLTDQIHPFKPGHFVLVKRIESNNSEASMGWASYCNLVYPYCCSSYRNCTLDSPQFTEACDPRQLDQPAGSRPPESADPAMRLSHHWRQQLCSGHSGSWPDYTWPKLDNQHGYATTTSDSFSFCYSFSSVCWEPTLHSKINVNDSNGSLLKLIIESIKGENEVGLNNLPQTLPSPL